MIKLSFLQQQQQKPFYTENKNLMNRDDIAIYRTQNRNVLSSIKKSLRTGNLFTPVLFLCYARRYLRQCSRALKILVLGVTHVDTCTNVREILKILSPLLGRACRLGIPAQLYKTELFQRLQIVGWGFHPNKEAYHIKNRQSV